MFSRVQETFLYVTRKNDRRDNIDFITFVHVALFIGANVRSAKANWLRRLAERAANRGPRGPFGDVRQQTERRRESQRRSRTRCEIVCARSILVAVAHSARLIGTSRDERRKDAGWGLAGRGQAVGMQSPPLDARHGSPIDRRAACPPAYLAAT